MRSGWFWKKREFSWRRMFFLSFSIALFLVFADQFSKSVISSLLSKNGNKEIWKNFFVSLSYYCNQNMLVGKIEVSPYLDYFLRITILSFLIAFLFISFLQGRMRGKKGQWIALLLIISGGASNLLSKVIWGCVLDPFFLTFLGLHFNLADMYIWSGIVFFAIDGLVKKKR